MSHRDYEFAGPISRADRSCIRTRTLSTGSEELGYDPRELVFDTPGRHGPQTPDEAGGPTTRSTRRAEA